jgi:hypothetical protein
VRERERERERDMVFDSESTVVNLVFVGVCCKIDNNNNNIMLEKKRVRNKEFYNKVQKMNWR